MGPPLTHDRTSASLPPMLKAVYAFIGEDDVSIQTKVRSLIETAVLDELLAFNLDQHSPGESSPIQIEESVLSPPMGDGRRVVIVRELKGFPESEQEEITEMAMRHAESTDAMTTLALVASGLDRRKRPFRTLKKLAESSNGQIKEFSAPKRWKMDEWISKRAAERGIRIDREAAGLLVDLIGEDLRTLDGELTKLELFLGTGAPIGVSAVEEVVGRRRGESVWDLPRRLLEGDAPGAQKLAGRLMEDGEKPVHLVSVTTQVVLDAWRIRVHLDRGASRGVIIEDVGLHQYYADANIAAAERIPEGAFFRMIETLKECDLALKSSAARKETLVQGLIARLALLSGSAAEGSGAR